MNASFDGFTAPLHQPATVAEAADLVRSQKAKHEAVYPVGGGTMLDFGLAPGKPGLALQTTKLANVIDYPARDMTITVQAGMIFDALQQVLAAEKQWLPIDVPNPQATTLGGAIACNLSGPRRFGHGNLRDYLLGITFLDCHGSEIHGGGRVVKNVAGYDLMKLHLGALGTMGLITQVTLKVKPQPEARRGLVIKPGRKLEELLALLHASKSRPFVVSYQSQRGILVGFEDKAVTVDWQLETLQGELTGFEFDIINDLNGEIQTAADLQLGSAFLAVAGVKPSVWAGLATTITAGRVFGEPLNGVLFVAANEPVDLPAGPRWVVRRAPTAWKTPSRVFGEPTPDFELMRHIRQTLDPDALFNSGRLFA